MSLKEVYRPYFMIGAAVSYRNLSNQKTMNAFMNQYDSMTCENDMKPENLLDEEANRKEPQKYDKHPVVCFDKIRPYLDYAKENGIKMRGHTLVWHNQTPRWFFTKDYANDKDAPLADRVTMLARMESYISQVLAFVQKEYPDVIYAWDVVNEAIEDGGFRQSLWTQTVGEDFVLHAFRFARQYTDQNVSLFYNDYNTFESWKRDLICEKILNPLIAEKLVDGMGMQAHLTMYEPALTDFEQALRIYGKFGIQVQITELDIHNADASKESMERLAVRYRELFEILLRAKLDKAANVTAVTFWGMQDEDSWLTGFRKEKSHPLLFESNFRPKLAYQAVVSVPGRLENDTQDRLPGGQRFDFWEDETKYTRELHVNAANPEASDENDGSLSHPFVTIQAAADRALPGTKVLIHKGVYRECVHPRSGGESPEKMISYEAFKDEEVVIKASILADSFEKSEGWSRTPFGVGDAKAESAQIWQVKLNPDEYRGYNPFCAVNILHDRLFIEYEKTDMTTYLNRRGMVFCDGKPLSQVALYNQLGKEEGTYWVEANGQTIHFHLKNDDNPNDHVIELTCREQCFAPETPFLSYIHVKGLTCAHAATGAPVPQRGAISCYRGHHWMIENCKIDWSNGVGIDIGNECWHHIYDKDQIIGHTIIRGCQIKDVGVCGIAGMFATNLLIEDNLIEGTGWQKMELSWEAGGIKVHNSIDSLIRRNIFTKTFRADHLWMDVGNENNRITRNLFLDGIEQREAIFIECSRDGINLIDNNIFWNIEGRFDPRDIPEEPGSTGWYKMEENSGVNGYAVYGEGTDRLHVVHNLIGKCRSAGFFVKPVSFRIAGNGRGGTSREAIIQNNLFYDCKEAAIKFPTKENDAQGNLYMKMPGGYLRVLYPAPENCLDLQAWQEFYGFDMQGQEGWFDIDIDTDQYILKVVNTTDKMPRAPHGTGTHCYVTEPEKVLKVQASFETADDFYGTVMDEERIPGPFTNLITEENYDIDPRQKRRKA